MLTKPDESAAAILDKRTLQTLGVLLPIRLNALSFFSGRHPLGRAGEGMRFLRTRPFEPGEDNPRDIDKFSPPGETWINEWEAEAQASVLVYADVSASMAFGPKAALRNLALLQLTYSLWRANDRVRTVLFSADRSETIAQRNLKSQLERLMQRLNATGLLPGRDAIDVLEAHAARKRTIRDDLIFLLSDFCPTQEQAGEADMAAWREARRAISCDVVPVIVSFELAVAQRGSIRLWDAERRAHRLTLLTPSRIARINAAEAQRVALLQKLFRRLGMDHLVLRQEADVYPELAKLARWRRSRRT
ncbi:MAG: hypothetical protein OEO82_02700 [Gammaproteobacteria bacterium]|nr:hypothetical protein [Gammaproteobacteria bacterium]